MAVMNEQDVVGGSWAPTIIIVIIVISRWLAFSQGDGAIRIRRCCQMQKIYWKKKLGFRDDSKYRMGAGDGANQKHVRQG
mmetsp:Transcript_23991/g.28289  ORF Transcript_23991/g.28289 Transcript_23991/m.28289 type:complete len:80 (-) Transcript_23991:525-764(-)